MFSLYIKHFVKILERSADISNITGTWAFSFQESQIHIIMTLHTISLKIALKIKD